MIQLNKTYCILSDLGFGQSSAIYLAFCVWLSLANFYCNWLPTQSMTLLAQTNDLVVVYLGTRDTASIPPPQLIGRKGMGQKCSSVNTSREIELMPRFPPHAHFCHDGAFTIANFYVLHSLVGD